MFLSRVEKSPAVNHALPAVLSEQQREAHPHVIYQHESQSAADGAVLAASVLVAQRAGLDVIADIGVNEETGQKQAVIRSANTKRSEVRAESMLLHGVHAITERTFFELSADEAASTTALEEAAGVAEAALRQVTDNPELRADFVKYYGGLRWGTDQEDFTANLFKHAAELDLAALPEYVRTGSDLAEIVYKLDLDIPYDERRNWHEQVAATVFAQVPEIDYQQLADPTFIQTPTGQRLAEAYREFSGTQLARLHKQYPRPINDAGEPIPKPIIPLSRFPIIEAIMTDEVSLSRPRAKYDMSPREVNDFILKSDSLPAQQALATSTTIRLPQEFRHVFDGPDELQHKRSIVLDLAHTYMQETDPARKEQFKLQLLDVFEAYTQNGRIADEVRAQHETERQNGLTWHKDTDQLKQIVQDMLVFGLASPDAESFIGRYMPDFEKSLATESDPLALTKNEMMLVVIDALDHISSTSKTELFELVARKVFQDDVLATAIGSIADIEYQAKVLADSPDVWLARRELAKHRGLLEKDNPQQIQAKETYDTAYAPSQQKIDEYRIAKNNLLLGLMQTMTHEELLRGDSHEANTMFRALVNRISFGDSLYETGLLPDVYSQLTNLVDRPDVTDSLKGVVFWKFSEHVRFSSPESAGLLVGAIIDGYRILLGEPNSLRLPCSETSLALSGLTHIAQNNPVFKYASQEQLATLAQYKNELLLMTERVIAGQITDGSAQHRAESADDEWLKTTMKNLSETLRSMESLESIYQKYLHMEDVKQLPHEYYPWMLEQLSPFWQKMNWEVGPGNLPKGDIRALHGVLKDHINGLLLIRDGEYPEGYDYFGSGHLGTLLYECYTRMFLNHDIQYNSTVWQVGMGFVSSAFRNMPPSLVEQFKSTYADRVEFMKFVAHSTKESR